MTGELTEALAALAWVEKKINKIPSDTTQNLLQLLDRFRLNGKRALLVAEGFLSADSVTGATRSAS